MYGTKILVAGALGLAAFALALQPAAAVNAYERDTADNGGPPSSNDHCQLFNVVAKGCFFHNGDKFYVQDWDADGHSVVVDWENYVSSGPRQPYELYRHGLCLESGGDGHGGYCNKNFKEGSKIRFRVCTYESATRSFYQCGDWTARLDA